MFHTHQQKILWVVIPFPRFCPQTNLKMRILAVGELPRSSLPFAQRQDGDVSLHSSMCENSLGTFVKNKLKMSRQRNVVSTKHIFSQNVNANLVLS